MHAIGFKHPKCSLLFILKLLISTVFPLVKKPRRLFDVGAAFIRGKHLKKRRVVHMKFESFIIISFQITANGNHYDI